MSDPLDAFLTAGVESEADGDPLDAVLANVARARISVAQRQGADPARIGLANRIALANGLPASVVEGNLASFERQEQANRASRLASASPGYRRWALEPRNAQLAAGDDAAISRVARIIGARATRDVADFAKAGGFFDRMGDLFKAGVYALDQGAASTRGALLEWSANNPLPWTSRANRQAEALKAAEAKGIARIYGQVTAAGIAGETTWEDVKAAPSLGSVGGFVLDQGVKSLPAMALAVHALGMSIAAQAGNIGVERARNEGREDADIADVSMALPAAALSSLLDRYGFEAILSAPGKNALTRTLKAAGAEGGTEFLQSVIEYGGGTIGTKEGFDLSGALDQGFAGAIAGAGMGAGIRASTEAASVSSRRIVRRMAQADAALNNQDAVDEVMAASAESSTRRHDPEAFRALIHQMAEDGDIKNLYVPAEAVQSYMQSDGYNGEFDDYRTAVEEGVVHDGDVIIPIDDAAAKLAGTPAWDAIRSEARISPGGPSPREAQNFNEAMADVIADLTEQMAQEMDAARAGAVPREKLVKSVTSKMQDAGFTPYVAKQWAELLTQRAATRAARTGKDLTGAEYDSLVINQVMPEALAQAQKADGLDIVINAMKRKADVNAAPGMSLLEFVSEKGGASDPGGDLAAMGAQDWHKGRAFKKRLVRDDGRTLDDLAMAAFEAGYFPGMTDRPTINDLLDAMGTELGGAPVFANFAREDAARADAAQAQLVKAADELRSLLQEVGLDPDKATAREIRQEVARYSERAEGAGFDQAGYAKKSDSLAAAERQVKKYAGGMGWKLVGRDSSRVSMSSYQVWEHAAYVDEDGNPVLVRLRFSDHALPLHYAQPDFDVRSTVADGGSYVASGGWLDALQYLAGLSGSEVPKAAVTQKEGVAKAKATKARKARVAAIDKALPALEANEEALRDAVEKGDFTASKSLSGATWYVHWSGAFNGKDMVYSGNKDKPFSPLAAAQLLLAEKREKIDDLKLERDSLTRPVDAYDQSFADGPRGRITFPTAGYGRGKTVIDLFQSRDSSTFLHEAGHLWLEELRFDALDPDASDQLKADWQAVQDWFAADGHPLQDGVIPVEAHEMWARSVERYIMEGKAPSPPLRKLFETLKSWMVQVYRAVARLNAPITDDIRAVMDRLIATDEEIAAAREEQSVEAAFTTKPAAMTDAEWQDYHRVVAEARDEADANVLARTMGAIKRRVTREYNEQKAAVRDEVKAEIDSRPEFRALRQLRNTPMDQAALSDIYGQDALAMLPKQVPPVYKDGGVSPNDVAELSGFASADELVRTLMGVETRRLELREGGDKRSVREALIAQETDARMLARYGDPYTDGSIEEEALAAIHSDKAGEVMAAELRVLGRGTRNRPTPYSVAKAWASRTIREGVVSQAASRAAIQGYRRAAAKSGKAYLDAAISGDADGAFRHKQAQMLNNALIAEAGRVNGEVESAVKRLSNWAKRKTVKAVDQDYLERAQALLAAVDMMPRSQRFIDKQAGFEAWAKEQEAAGHDVVVPASFAASLGSTHWSRLTVEQLLGLDAAVSQIIHLGKFKQTLIDGKEAREKEALIAEAEGQGDRIGRKPPTDLQNPEWRDKMKAGILSFDAALLKTETVVDWLDEGRSDGVFNRVVFKPIADAEARERGMLHDYYARIRKAFEGVGKDQLKRWQEHYSTPELLNRETGNPRKFRRSDLVAMALNMGNAGNIQRLVDGYGYNEAVVREVLNRELTAQDWQFVQSVWDTIDTLWPEVAALERRINGVEPEKVEAVPVQTPHGTYRGGYYPAIYDTSKSYAAEYNSGKESDLFETVYSRSTTRASSTKERSEQVKRPILLDLGVINRHLGEVIHDITHREAVMNADRFLSEPRIQRLVDDVLGPENRKQFRPWLKFVANQWAMERSGNEGVGKFLQKWRANTTVVGMGFRFTTILTQIAGYSNSFEKVGAKWVAPAIAQTARHPIETFDFVLSRSAEVKGRLDTLDRDINATMREMAGSNKAGNALTAAKRFAFHGIGYMDRVVVVPTWLGAYNKALASGMDEQAAIYEGDKAVRVSQGSSSAKDMAAIQRGTGKHGEMLKAMTMFYSYMSAYYQRQRTLGRDIASANVRDMPALLARAWWLIVVPPVLTSLLSGNGPEEDEDWSLWAFKEMLFNSLGAIPLVRDVARPLWDKAAGEKGFDYQLSPIQRGAQTVINTAGDVGKIARGDETTRATRNALESIGYTTGLVPGQIAASAQFLVDIGEGDADPQTIGEWYEGLTKGRIKED